MHTRSRIGRVGGVTLMVDWSVLVLLLLMTWVLARNFLPSVVPGEASSTYWWVGMIGAVLVLASLFAHEFAHALVARREGVTVDGLTLWMLGGVTRLGSQARTAGAEFRIAGVGPATSALLAAGFALAAVILSALSADPVARAAAWWLALMNGSLAVFNLLPGSPLDGGRVLTALLWRRRGDHASAAMTAARAGRALGVALCAVAALLLLGGDVVGGVWMVLIGAFLVMGARAEYAASLAERLLGAVRADALMSTPVSVVPETLTVERFVAAHLLGGRHSVYPIMGADGNVRGIVGLQQVRAVPRQNWPTTTVAEIALPLDQVRVCRPGDPATGVLEAPDGQGRTLVMDNGTLVGIITHTDLVRAMRARALLSGSSH